MSEPRSADATVSLMSRLLSDAELRRQFHEDRQSVVARLTDDPEAMAFLESVDSQQLDAQAETLISKRQHEVAELMPQTWLKLSDDAGPLFRNYVEQAPWPEGHLRHVLDALEFATWLSHSQHAVVGSERNRITFAASDGRFSIRLLRNDTVLFGVQILMRQRSGRIRQSVLGLRWPLWR